MLLVSSCLCLHGCATSARACGWHALVPSRWRGTALTASQGRDIRWGADAPGEDKREPTFASLSRPSAHMCMPLPDMSHEQNRPQEPYCPRQIWFCEAQIAVIVLLASDEECLHKTGCNLRALYLKEGFQVLYLPIPDFGVPTREDLEQAIQQTIAYAQAGHHIVIHCSAGIGRTGLFTAYLAKRWLRLSGAEALQWVRRYIPRAVETPE